MNEELLAKRGSNMVQCPPTGGCAVKRLIRKRKSRLFRLSAGSWPRRQCSGRCWRREHSCCSRRKDGSARGRSPRVGCAAHLPCDPSGRRACLSGRGALSFAAAGRRGGCGSAGGDFAALHGSWTARAYALGMGLIFGWAAQKAKSVWPGSALHIINNCLVFAARLAERGMG